MHAAGARTAAATRVTMPASCCTHGWVLLLISSGRRRRRGFRGLSDLSAGGKLKRRAASRMLCRSPAVRGKITDHAHRSGHCRACLHLHAFRIGHVRAGRGAAPIVLPAGSRLRRRDAARRAGSCSCAAIASRPPVRRRRHRAGRRATRRAARDDADARADRRPLAPAAASLQRDDVERSGAARAAGVPRRARGESRARAR